MYKIICNNVNYIPSTTLTASPHHIYDGYIYFGLTRAEINNSLPSSNQEVGLHTVASRHHFM